LALEVSSNAEVLAERMLGDAYELVMGGWCQGCSAQDEMGRPIEPSSAFARRWSAPGALERIWRRCADDADVALEAFERANLALAAAVKEVPETWNDAAERTAGEVLDALRQAVPLVGKGPEAPESLVEDLLDDPGRYEAIPSYLIEPST
jgi:hypothetical protein